MKNEIFDFLKRFAQNNNREWFLEHKKEFDIYAKQVKEFVTNIYQNLQKYDSLEGFHIYRVYNDVRFHKNKPLYKTHFGISFSRTKPMLRGGYYLHLEPESSFVGGGFWAPSPEDLLRIRKEFEMDDSEIRQIIHEENFRRIYGDLKGEDGVKTAPKGFDKNHPAIDLIRKKQFVAMRNLSDTEVFSTDFPDKILESFLALRPWFDYMSDVLTTNMNGELIIK